MINPEDVESTQEFERKILSTFPVQDPDPLFVDRLQKKLADRFKGLEGYAQGKDEDSGRSPRLGKNKFQFSPLAWGALGIIFLLFLVWGIKTLLPKVEPSLSTKTTPAPTIVTTLAPTQAEGAENVINLPVLAGTPVPLPQEAITSANAGQITQLAGWGGATMAKVWAPDGNSFAVASSIGVYIYDSASFAEIAKIAAGTSITNMVYSRDGKFLAVGTSTGLFIYDGITFEEIHKIAEDSGIYTFVFSPDGTKLAAGLSDNSIKLWEVASGGELLTLTGYTSWITSLVFSPDATLLASSAYQEALKVWDVDSGQQLYTISGAPNSFVFSPDGSFIALGLESGQVKIVEAASGQELRTLSMPTGWPGILAISPDGTQLVTCTEMTIILWDTATGNELQTITRQSYINGLAFLPDGKSLVFSVDGEPITVWDISSERELRSLGDASSFGSFTLSPDGRTILFSDYQAELITLYDIASGEELHRLEWSSFDASSLAFSPDGSLLAAGMGSGAIRLFNLTNGQELRSMAGHTGGVNSLAFSPDGTRLASGSADSTNILWDATTGEQLFSMEGVKEFGWGTGAVASVDFSPDGQLLAVGASGGQVKVWDVATQAELQTLGGQAGGTATDAVAGVAFSPDGKLVASGYAVPWAQNPSHLITLWDPTSGQEVRSLEYAQYQQLNVASLAFSPDGKTLAAGYWEAKVTLWDVASGYEIYTVSFPWQDEISSVAFSPNGDLLAIGCGNGIIVLLEAESGQQLATLPNSAYVLAFSPDGKLLVSSTYDGTIRLWGLPPQGAIPMEVPTAATQVGAVSLPTIATQSVPEELGMEKIPIPVLLSGEGLQSWWWSPGGSYLPYSQQGPVGEAGPDQATNSLYFLDARTGEICPSIQETVTYTQTEWGPSPVGSFMFDRTYWMDDNHLFYINPSKEFLVLSPCSDAIENWTASLPEAINSIANVKQDGSQIILRGEQAYWLLSPSTLQSIKLDVPLPDEGAYTSVGWMPGEEMLYAGRIEDRQGVLWIVLESVDPGTGSASQILEVQASAEVRNSSPMWPGIDWMSKEQVIVENAIDGMTLYDLSSQPIQSTNLFPDVFGIEYPGMGRLNGWGPMCGGDEAETHLMLDTGMGPDGQYYIYHPDTGAVDQYPLDPPLLVVYPCGEGGIAQSYMDSSSSNNTYKVILVDSGVEPFDLVVKGHPPGQTIWAFATVLPGGQRVLFSSTQGISLVDLMSGEILNFWGLADQVEYQDMYAYLSPDGKSVVGLASQKGQAPGAGASIQDMYWLRLEP